MRPPNSDAMEHLLSAYQERQELIRQRLDEFTRVPPGEYFFELIYCLLTPQSSAVNAGKAVRLLRERNILFADLDPEPLLHQPDFYIRFHRTKAKHILAVKQNIAQILNMLSNGRSSSELREWLVENVKGLGWKEASHFLRNIGHRDLAILDRHILKNLIRLRVIRGLPTTLTPKRYLAIEQRFKTFSSRIGIPMDELDLLFWSLETGEILK